MNALRRELRNSESSIGSAPPVPPSIHFQRAWTQDLMSTRRFNTSQFRFPINLPSGSWIPGALGLILAPAILLVLACGNSEAPAPQPAAAPAAEEQPITSEGFESGDLGSLSEANTDEQAEEELPVEPPPEQN
jgi:hypothetical protein